MCNNTWFSPPSNSFMGGAVQEAANRRYDSRNRQNTTLCDRINDFLFIGGRALKVIGWAPVYLVWDLGATIPFCLNKRKVRRMDNLKNLVAHTSLIFQSIPMLFCGVIPKVDYLRTVSNFDELCQSLPFCNIYNPFWCIESKYDFECLLEQLEKLSVEERNSIISKNFHSILNDMIEYKMWDRAEKLLNTGFHHHDFSENIIKCNAWRPSLFRQIFDRIQSDFVHLNDEERNDILDDMVLNLGPYPTEILFDRIMVELSVLKCSQITLKSQSSNNQSMISIQINSEENKSEEMDVLLKSDYFEDEFETKQNKESASLTPEPIFFPETQMREIVNYFFQDRFIKFPFITNENIDFPVKQPSQLQQINCEQIFEKAKESLCQKITQSGNYSRHTLFTFAVIHGLYNEVKKLLDLDADPNQTNPDGFSPLELLLFLKPYWPAQEHHWIKALNYEDPRFLATAKLLISRNASFCSRQLMDPNLLKVFTVPEYEFNYEIIAKIENRYLRCMTYEPPRPFYLEEISQRTQNLEFWHKHIHELREEHYKTAMKCLKAIQDSKILSGILDLQRLVAQYAHEGMEITQEDL